jgi:hypothetical protein
LKQPANCTKIGGQSNRQLNRQIVRRLRTAKTGAGEPALTKRRLKAELGVDALEPWVIHNLRRGA